MAKTKVVAAPKKGKIVKATSGAKTKRVARVAALGRWSARDIEAARTLKDVYAAPVSPKLQGKKSKAIRRAVFSYYQG
jgi:hypothetical protein